MTEVQACKAEYERKEEELAIEQEKAEKAKQDAEAVKEHQESKVMVRAIRMYLEEEKRLKKAYKTKENVLHGAFLGTILYSFLVTAFTAVRSETFVSDFKAFFTSIWSFVCLCIEKLLEAAKWASQLGGMISQPIVAAIVHWLIQIVVVVAVIGGTVFLLFIGGKKICYGYKENFADLISLADLLVSFAVVVFFADPLRDVLPINLFLLLFVFHMAYICVRQCIKGWRRARG